MSRFLVLVLLCLVVVPSVASASAPTLINFQGILKDGLGNPVVDGAYIVTFLIYNVPAGGTVLWTEAQGVNTTDGLFNVMLGSSTPIADSVFRSSSCYLTLQVNGDPEMTPRQQLVSVGYSFRVNSVDSASGGTITSKVSIGPGHTNTGADAFVAGNGSQATGDQSAIGGGRLHVASGIWSTIGGGDRNVASGLDATVSGGGLNRASGDGSTVAGGSYNHANGPGAVVGGGSNDTAMADYATVGGGLSNAAMGSGSFIGGGNLNRTGALLTTIAGGDRNVADGIDASIGGGGLNHAAGDGATIAGGTYHLATGGSSSIGGGSLDTATAGFATISGGRANVAAGIGSSIGGGDQNRATGLLSSIAGGDRNIAAGTDATVGGGALNVASGGASTVSGGIGNSVSGEWATVPGGANNAASANISMAAGYRAKASHLGTYVWADSSVNADFTSTANNQYLIRAAGGVGINTATPPAGALQVIGGVVVGAGTAMQTILSSTASLDFPSTAAATASDLTITVTGASTGDVVALGVPNGSVTAGGAFWGWVSAANTVTVRFNNASGVAANPASGTFRAMVTHF